MKSPFWTFVIVSIVVLIALYQGDHSHSPKSIAAPYVPAVNADMSCPSIVSGVPDVLGSQDGATITCWAESGSPIVKAVRVSTDTSGGYTWTYPSACVHGGNVPAITAIAEGPNPQNGANVNVQIEGAPSSTTASFRVTKTQNTTVALLSLTITVSVTGTSIGATTLDLTCTPQ